MQSVVLAHPWPPPPATSHPVGSTITVDDRTAEQLRFAGYVHSDAAGPVPSTLALFDIQVDLDLAGGITITGPVSLPTSPWVVDAAGTAWFDPDIAVAGDRGVMEIDPASGEFIILTSFS